MKNITFYGKTLIWKKIQSLRKYIGSSALILCLLVLSLSLCNSAKCDGDVVFMEGSSLVEPYFNDSSSSSSLSLIPLPYIGFYVANESLSNGPKRAHDVEGVRVTVSFYGTDMAVIQNDNYLVNGIAARGQDSVHSGFMDSIDWEYIYALVLVPSLSANPLLYIEVLQMEEWTGACTIIRSVYISYPGITMNSYITLTMEWGVEYLYYYVDLGGGPRILDAWTPNTTAICSFPIGTVPHKIPSLSVKFLQFAGALSRYPILHVGWYTHLSAPSYKVNGSWNTFPYAYSTDGLDAWLDYRFLFGGIWYPNVNAYYGPQYVHFSYNPQGVTLPSSTELWAPLGGGGGCPYVYVWNGQNYVLDNNLLPTSEISNGADVKDYYKLEQPLIPTYQGTSFSIYSLQLREFEHEHDYFDQIKLLAVDYESNVNVAVSPYGEILTYTNPDPPISAFDETGISVLSLVNTIDGNYYQSHNGSYITLTFSHREILNGIKLVIREDRPPVLKCPVDIQVLNATGGWNTVATFFTRTYWATDIINMTAYLPDPEGNLKVRFCFIANDKIDYVGIDTNPQANIQIHQAILLSAVHSSLKNVRYLLTTDDENYAELVSGQLMQLMFLLPNDQTKVRTFILYSEGHYNTIS